MKPLLIFDLDGTLYTFDNGNSRSFGTSTFYSKIKGKMFSFISRKLGVDDMKAREIYDDVKEEFRGETSIGLEKKFGIDRYEYFENTWNLDPRDFIEKRDLLPLISSLEGEVAVLTAAPRAWASKVLDYLNLGRYNGRLFTGEHDLRKPNPEMFRMVCESMVYKPENAISIGDQLESDIIPAKAIGMKTILIRGRSDKADYCISSLDEIPSILRRIK